MFNQHTCHGHHKLGWVSKANIGIFLPAQWSSWCQTTVPKHRRHTHGEPWKKCQFILDYNFHVSWRIFTLLVL